MNAWKPIQNWWNPFPEISPQTEWPVRILDTSPWLDSYFQQATTLNLARRDHIEKGIGLVLTVIIPLVGLLGFVVLNLPLNRSNWILHIASTCVLLSLCLLVWTAFCSARAWYGHAYAYGTPAEENLRQIDLITSTFKEQGFAEDAHILAQDEVRDRMTIVHAYCNDLNHRVNNLRGIWLHRARTSLLLGGVFVITSVLAHITESRLHELDQLPPDETRQVMAKDNQPPSKPEPSKPNPNSANSNAGREQRPRIPFLRPEVDVPRPSIEIRKDSDGGQKK
ncbi:hypothetical protein FRC96_04665 [Lujinxingia vulgaris]|uniref:Uncharacterized protein n=2 Tax=Lujinxingia vulgaris TaxID=2600176 RepID=A0A5C6XJI5_9DELT|nr:hypothetical protein FRC96_04665 [Lujinxingia vulgaris]